MPITLSEILWDHVQADGRRVVREQHTDHLGLKHVIDWIAESDVNVVLVANARALTIENDLKRAEMTRNLAAIFQNGPAATVTTQYLTMTDIRVELRSIYPLLIRAEAVALGAFLNTLTNIQLGTLFGVSGTQLTNLRTRLQARATQWTDLQNAVGE